MLALEYTHSAHQVMVYLDVTLAPEFPEFMILPLFMILSVVFAALASAASARYTVECKSPQESCARVSL